MTLNDAWQRILAVGLLLIPLALIYLTVVAPYLDYLAENRERIEDLKFQLQRLQRAAAKAPLWRRQLEILESAGRSGEQHFLKGTTPTLAAAELQNRLGEIIRSAGGETTSTQTLAGKAEGAFTRVAVRVRFTASTPALRRILHTVEAEKPLLIVENLRIRPVRGRRDPKTRKTVPVDRLNVDMRVVGYLHTPAS